VPPGPPPSGTVQRWCFDLIATRDLGAKLAPPQVPDLADDASWEQDAPTRRIAAPGRPDSLRVTARSPKTPSRGSLVRAEVRARLFHTFAHHELQAAELFCWGVLAFPGAPRELHRGLVRLALEELEHLALYRAHMNELGLAYGDLAVRDWFWQRVPSATDAIGFVAFVGLGLEGANLEHSARFAEWFRGAGDAAGAAVLERVERDEVGHVAFARRWFERLTGAPLDFDAWADRLPRPLTPMLLRGLPLNVEARRHAGLDDAFLARLAGTGPFGAASGASNSAPSADPNPDRLTGGRGASSPVGAKKVALPETVTEESTDSAESDDAARDSARDGDLRRESFRSDSARQDTAGSPTVDAVAARKGAARSSTTRSDTNPHTPIAWVLNFDAEEELAAPRRYAPTDRLRAIAERQTERVLADGARGIGFVLPGDVIVDEHTQPGSARGLVGRAWCPTPRALALLERAGAVLDGPAPSLDVLRRVNARPFTADLRAHLEGAPFEKRVANDLDEALALVTRPAPLGWLVRRTFGAAGRGRLRMGPGAPTEHERRWLIASSRRGPLVIEPWVDVLEEITVSGTVGERGEIVVAAPCFQATTSRGAWTGTERAGAGDLGRSDDDLLLSACEGTGRALFAAGFTGPFGIDAFRYRTEPGAPVRLNALSEINARLTMDRGVAFAREGAERPRPSPWKPTR
jgi:uncharacterized ferritin-like protein (DUF455 family)